ncbi:MAG: ATP-binding protein [Candidatus Cloacimonetes bacterium]|nr:ATP-binding protein [Candidatus Cloacimonadota bacterium]
MTVDNVKVFNLASAQNPWWKDSKDLPSEQSWPKFEAFFTAQKELKLPLMTLLTGLRRTGKTTILKQLVADLLKRGENPERILYFSFEQEPAPTSTETLEALLEIYLTQVLKTKVSQVKTPTFIFLDEIQFVERWQNILKRYYDLNKNFKFILSGSASTILVWPKKESLAGRIFEVIISPLSFREFLRLKKEKVVPKINLEKELKESELFDWQVIARQEGGKLDELYLEYLARGQFPEIVGWDELQKIRSYLISSILEKIILVDLPKVFDIQSPQKLREIFSVLAQETGSLVEYQNLAVDLGLSRQTLADYVSYLEAGYLINVLFSSSGSFRRRLRKRKKIYAASPNITTSLQAITEKNPEFGQIIGRLVETAILSSLQKEFQSVYFWRQNGKEVDFIVRTQTQILPIEVKFQSSLKKSDLANLFKFMQKNALRRGFLISRNQLELVEKGGLKIIIIPAWFM